MGRRKAAAGWELEVSRRLDALESGERLLGEGVAAVGAGMREACVATDANLVALSGRLDRHTNWLQALQGGVAARYMAVPNLTVDGAPAYVKVTDGRPSEPKNRMSVQSRSLRA